MATASHIELSPKTTGVFHTPEFQAESAKVGSHLLQENHLIHHVFFNNTGFHNHIPHHLLTIFALGASAEEIKKAYDNNLNYQRRQYPVKEKTVEDMADKAKFSQFLGREKYYQDYVAFFQKEMDVKGWEAVLNEYVFAGDERANLMFTRLFSGFLHPVIHLGFGVEFQQPAIIAEALAQTAVHSNWMSSYILGAEEIAASSEIGKNNSSATLVDLLREISSTEKLRTAAHWDDADPLRGAVLKRAPNDFANLAAKWRVSADELEEKTAQMINTCAYFAGASQNPPKQVRFDFMYIHCINASIFYTAFLNQKWLSTENKIRLLEGKGRLDLAMYASQGCPKLLIDEIKNYKPLKEGDWNSIFSRVACIPDDGHVSKLVRALGNGEQACKPFEDKDGFQIKGKMWLQLGHMAIDSVEGEGRDWIRNVGWDKAWKGVPDRAKA